uniref:Cilia- and flagella-associated protein 251-like n=1 Tax=Diabrotica virgifera virgifera TaxID=50390 RepID=A0A6P7FGP5_DIAVI
MEYFAHKELGEKLDQGVLKNRRGGEKERDETQGEKRWRREVEETEDPESRNSANRSKGKEREYKGETREDEEGESSSSDNESSSADESEEEEQSPNCNARTKLESLQNSVAALEKLMAEVPNTRVAIKQEVDNLRNRLFDYTEEVEESKEKEEVPRKSVCTTSRGVQTNVESLKAKKTATMGVQVDLENPEAIKRRVDAITEKKS